MKPLSTLKEKSMSTIRVMTININGSLSEEADTNVWQKRVALTVKTINLRYA